MDLHLFIESERVKQNITKRSLAASADISPQYYDLIIKGESIENRRVTELLLLRLGFKLCPMPVDFFTQK
jgi:hypothetical protein